MPYPPLSLLKRLVLGIPLTPAQEDQNMTDIETAVNAQASQLAAALNSNGTLKPGSVNTAAIQDRAVTNQKLAFLYAFYAVDTGGANAMVITFAPPLTAYAAGLLFYVKAAATNTGNTTLNVDGLGAQSVKKYNGLVISEMAPGEIVAGDIYEIIYDGGQFIVLNPTQAAVVAGPVFLAGPQTVYALGPAQPETSYDASAFVPAGAKAVILQARQRWNSATDGEIVTTVRPDNLAIPLILSRTGGTDAIATANQGIYPISAARHFLYTITTTVPGVGECEIILVGYYV